MPAPTSIVPTQPLDAVAAESAATPFDCVVAGGGTTGLVVASELARLGRRVALLEAGPASLAGHANNTELRYNGTAVRDLQRAFEYSPQAANGTPFGSFVSCLGGRGLFWNGSAPRFQDFDFDGWPVSAADLAAAYRLAEQAFRVTAGLGAGPLASRLLQSATAAGIDARPGPFAVDIRPSTQGIVGGTVGNGLAILLRAGVLGTPRLRLSANAFVERVLLDASGAKAAGLAVRDPATSRVFEVLGRSVVLAAGAFESVRIALASALPDPGRLLGTRLSEHIFCRAYYQIPPSWYDTRPEVALLHVPAARRARFQLELHAPGARMFRIRDEADWNPQANDDYAAMVRSFGSVLPRPENRLELKAATGLGGYTVHLDRAPADDALLATMQQAMENLRAKLGLSPGTIAVRPPGSSYHECGGLWMGTDPAASVTDATGAFHRVPNLVSADAANWPDLPAANPHLTLTAFAFHKSASLAARL